jgi:dephospho-CoA kinase
MIVGICGFQSSGKDTVANILVKNYGFVKLSFASALKDIVAIIFGWSRDKLEGLTPEDRQWREEIDPKWAKSLNISGLTPRYVLQHLATDVFRNHFHPDIWTKIVENQLSLYENVVISDCRFANEIAMLQNSGGTIIQVHRNLPHWFEKYANRENVEEANLLHCSELEWIRCPHDYAITNDGSISDLQNKIRDLLYNGENR